MMINVVGGEEMVKGDVSRQKMVKGDVSRQTDK
jgi:hypothetical protein